MTKTSELLRAARAKIEKPEAWTKEVSACDAQGECVQVNDVSAVRWSLFGALLVVPQMTIGGLNKALKALGRELPVGLGSPVAFSNYPSTTHADILALFDRAIEAAEKAGADHG